MPSLKQTKKKKLKKKQRNYKMITLQSKKDIINYKKSTLTNGEWIVLHYSLGCHHCIEMKPIWNAFKKTKPKINILEIEANYFDMIDFPKPIFFVPTIHYLNAKAKIVKQFEGQVILNKLLSFVSTSKQKPKPKRKPKIKSRKRHTTKQKGSGNYKIIDKDIATIYHKNLLKNGKWILLIHSHYCPHCVHMMPEWNTFKQSKPNINILELESNDLSNIELPKQIQIQGYPTILFINNGNIVEFKGERTAKQFRQFIETL